jgi:dipeptidyl aminopeptidase/acylaminoacyl peptidase
MFQSCRILCFLLVMGLLAQAQPAQSAAAGRPFTFDDMMALKRIGEPAVSPDGKWVAFSAVEVDLERNTRTPHLWIVPLAGGSARQLTAKAGEERPRWSPQGDQLLFISPQNGVGVPQVWVQRFDSAVGGLAGEPRQVTLISTGASGALWSPDGQTIVFTSEVYPGCANDACNQQRNEQHEHSNVKASIFTRLFFRHWSTYTLGKKTHIFAVSVNGGQARDLTPGDHDAPPFSLGGQDMYAISPDGKELAFTSNIDEVPATSTNNDLFLVPLAGGTPKKITTNPASDSTPLYSPDGRWIAYRAQFEPGYESDRFRLMLYDRKSGQIRNLTESLDRWVESFAWSPDSKTIYLTADDKGDLPIYRVAVDAGASGRTRAAAVKQLVGGTFDELSVAPDGGALVATQASVEAPAEVVKVSLSSARPAVTDLSRLNEALLSGIHMSSLEPFWFTGANNDRVEGFILKPPGFDPGKKYPVKFLIHGGPEGAWDNSWSYRWNPNLFAAGGYVAVMINFHGSTGYGQAFTRSIRGDWGGKPYVDLMRGLDYVIAHDPYVDGSRVCALGASYGGYMIDWILGHTDRFRCLVSHDGAFNLEAMYGSTEELWFPEWEFEGTPWTNRAMYERWSPNRSAASFKTPTLVVHGQLDYRLDVSQGFELYTTLQRLKIPSKMLYFPDEGHWVLKPQNSQLWYKTVDDWVDSYLKMQ